MAASMAPAGDEDDALERAIQMSMEQARQRAASPPAARRRTASPPSRLPPEPKLPSRPPPEPKPPADYDVRVTYADHELRVRVPRSAQLKALKEEVARQAHVRASSLNFVGWPSDPADEPSDDTPLSRLMGTTGDAPVPLFAIVDDSVMVMTPGAARAHSSPKRSQTDVAWDDDDDSFMDVLDDVLDTTATLPPARPKTQSLGT